MSRLVPPLAWGLCDLSPPVSTIGILHGVVHRLFASEMHSLADSSLVLSPCLIISGCLYLFEQLLKGTVLMYRYKEPHVLLLVDSTPLVPT